MKYSNLIEQHKIKVDYVEAKEYKIADEVLKNYFLKTNEKFEIIFGSNPVEDLLYTYFEIKKNNKQKSFDEILNLYSFNYSMSIHNAIYYLLATEDEKVEQVNPLLWPGIISINDENSKYILNTILGKIVVYQAHKMFLDTPSKYIFEKSLMGNCYNRSYDFVKENEDYKVILSYMPNFFFGGHYHAYLEKDGVILDIASNAYYDSIESINKIFCGEFITSLSYNQIEKQFSQLKKQIPNINSQQKLLSLALYNDIKNNKK